MKQRSILALAFCLTASWTTPRAGATAANVYRADLAVSGTGGVQTYRIPALARTVRGTLIAVYDERVHSSADLPNEIHLAERRSTDGGRTWSPRRTIVAFPEGGTGDASLLVDRETGRVFLFFNYGPPGIGLWNSKSGNRAGANDTMHIELERSDDDGESWSRPVDLNPEVKNAQWAGTFSSSGHGVQLRSGRLLQPFVAIYRKHSYAGDLYSDDHGATWHAGAFAGANVNESKALQLPNGDVVQNMRYNDGGMRYVAVSTDGGRTFAAMRAQPALPDPGVNGDEIAVGRALFFANAADPRVRRNLTVRTSCDGGRTWRAALSLHPGPAAYAAMMTLENGVIGVLYENGARNPYEKITFARLQPPACPLAP